MFPNEEFRDILSRIWKVSEDTIIYSITDSMIYGNWMFTLVTSVFLSNWFCFWTVVFSTAEKKEEIAKEKKD